MLEKNLDPDFSSPRKIGAILFALGLLLTFIGIYEPISSAMAHERSVSIHYSAILLGPIPLGFGFFHLGWGEKSIRVFGSKNRPTKAGTVLAIILGVIGVVGIFIVRNFLKSSGYDV